MTTFKWLMGLVGLACAGCALTHQPAAQPGSATATPANEPPLMVLINEPLGVDRKAEPVLGGIPVAQGRIPKAGFFILADAAGREFIVEGSAAAFWPDGSVKWLHLCGQVDLTGGVNRFTLRPAPPAERTGLQATAEGNRITVRDGPLTVSIGSDPSNILSVTTGAADPRSLLKAPGLSGRLVYVDPAGQRRQDSALTYTGARPEWVVRTANRVVVRLPGRFEAADGTLLAELITFFEVIRGVPEIRIEPVWIYLGSPTTDLVKELSLTVHAPVESNASVFAFANGRGEGFWDVVQRFRDQDRGPGPRWPMARQVQSGSSFYRTEKLTVPEEASWLKATEGRQAQGWSYLGDSRGGIVAAMRYYWQEYPHSLAVDGDAGTLTFGLIPAEAAPLDLRRYSPVVYGGAFYEAGKGAFRTELHGPAGLAKSFELMVRVHDAAGGAQAVGEEPLQDFMARRLKLGAPWQTLRPWFSNPDKQGHDLPDSERQAMIVRAREHHAAMTNLTAEHREWVQSRRSRRIEQVVKPGLFFTRPCRVLVPPQAFADSRVLGHVAAGGTNGWPAIEQRIRNVMNDTLFERDYQNWYGLLDFGDLQMAYYSEGGLNRWGFDHGGYAWLNTEGLPDYGMWISALRCADPGWMEAAIEMSRHNRDLDTYHRGELVGTGSRHGINHWSDPDKEWRVSMPLARRLHYYTTADPWTKEVILDTVAVYQSYTNRTTGLAPSMTSAFAGVLVKWEMSGSKADEQTVRNLAGGLAASVREDGAFANQFRANLATGESHPVGNRPLSGTFFLYGFGGQHALVEAAGLLNDPALDQAIIRNARMATGEAQIPFQAYAYALTKDAQLGDRLTRNLRTALVMKPGRAGGAGLFEEPEHPTFGGNIPNKNMCAYLGDMLSLLPYGMAVIPEEPPAVPKPAR